jgi:hypothetical protein
MRCRPKRRGSICSVNSSPTDIDRRHLVITLYAKTYSCVPENSGYCRILRAEEPFADFPRAHVPDDTSSLYVLKPMIYDEQGMS